LHHTDILPPPPIMRYAIALTTQHIITSLVVTCEASVIARDVAGDRMRKLSRKFVNTRYMHAERSCCPPAHLHVHLTTAMSYCPRCSRGDTPIRRWSARQRLLLPYSAPIRSEYRSTDERSNQLCNWRNAGSNPPVLLYGNRGWGVWVCEIACTDATECRAVRSWI
jgi:hypothetical protein